MQRLLAFVSPPSQVFLVTGKQASPILAGLIRCLLRLQAVSVHVMDVNYLVYVDLGCFRQSKPVASLKFGEALWDFKDGPFLTTLACTTKALLSELTPSFGVLQWDLLGVQHWVEMD